MNRTLAYYYSMYLNMVGVDDSDFRADGIYNEDASSRLAFGLCKKYGIDTKGMTPKEAWEALREKTGKSTKELAKGGSGGVGSEEKSKPSIGVKSKYRKLRDSIAHKFKGQDGTIDPDTGELMEFDDGFQVAFQTSVSEDADSGYGMDDDDYDKTVRELENRTGSKAYIGNFDVPEVSFHCKTMEEAMDIAKEYNQQSIFNWKAAQELEWTDENMAIIFPPNPYYDSSKNHVKGQ